MTPSNEPQRTRRERLSDESQRILIEIDEIHDLETQKRDEDISTPAYHDLADQVLDKSREIFRSAGRASDQDDDVETTDISLNDIEPKR